MTDETTDGHVVEWLDAWRTDELGPDRARAVETHLETCAGCREALAELEAFARTVEAGYREAESAAEEPDWGASRAAVVARTSGARKPARSWLPRWAPQVALVLVAVLAIGVLVEEGVRGPDDVGPALRETTAEDPAEAPADEETSFELDRIPSVVAPPATDSDESGRRADAVADAEPEREEGAANEAAPVDGDREGQAAEGEVAEAPAEPPPAELAQKALAPTARFRVEARAALAERDTLQARDALEFFADSVEADVLEADERARLEVLADSLAAFLSSMP